jgi:hypothetical protein
LPTTRRITVELPEEAARAIDCRPEDLPGAIREAAVLRWFEEGRLSQGQAAAALGLKRGRFFDLLAKHRVSPVQITSEEFAGRLGIPVLGTMRVILLAKERGLLPADRPKLDRLLKAGAHVREQLIEQVIALAGETSPSAVLRSHSHSPGAIAL